MDSIHKINKIQIAISLLLLLGLAAAAYLSQTPQTYKSKATLNPFDGFEVTGVDGNALPHTDTSGGRIYQTNDLDVKIRIQDINALVNP